MKQRNPQRSIVHMKKIHRTRSTVYDGSFLFLYVWSHVFFRDPPIQIPEILPSTGTFPEEDLSFDETAVFIIFCNGFHLFCGQRVFCHTGKIGLILGLLNRERNGYLPPLNRPFEADVCRMNAVGFGCRCYGWKLGISYILCCAVSLRPGRRTQRAVADG